MVDQTRILFTGGSGLLGGEIRKHLPEILMPSSSDFNVTDFDQMDAYLSAHACDLIVHAAAFTSPPRAEEQPELALDANLIGTANIVKICMKHRLRLIYISTDYVFRGDEGNYDEDAPVFPVNKYAWSKLGGECAVQLYDQALIVRTSFGANEFPYPKAFTDQWTSRVSVSQFAQQLIPLLDKKLTGILHVAGDRKTVYQYAKSLDPNKEIGKLSRNDTAVPIPKDTSLDIEKYKKLD
jgi:dTDP-4-dehydrorhamnose reductase